MPASTHIESRPHLPPNVIKCRTARGNSRPGASQRNPLAAVQAGQVRLRIGDSFNLTSFRHQLELAQ
jgi:hypothetical protein